MNNSIKRLINPQSAAYIRQYRPGKKPEIMADTADMQLTVNGKLYRTVSGQTVLDNDRWLSARRTGIGGSDAGAILGINPPSWHSDASSLYVNKTEGKKKKASAKQNAIFFQGHVEEETIRDYYYPRMAQILGKNLTKVRKDTRMYRHGNPEYAFAIADIDGLVVIDGITGGLEIKHPFSAFSQTVCEIKEGKIPAMYEAQMRHYMAVLNLPYFEFCVKWGNDPDNDMVILHIERDLDKEAVLMGLEKDFWDNHVVKRVPPDGTPVFSPASSDRPVDLTGKDAAEKAFQLLEEAKELEERASALSDQAASKKAEGEKLLVGAMNGATEASYRKGSRKYKVSIKQQVGRASYDMDAVRQKFPEIFNRHAFTTMKVTELNGTEKALISPYRLPGEVKDTFKVNVREVKRTRTA